MTFFELSVKMLKANLRRYRLTIGCNLLPITLFYCFASLFTNKSFMDYRTVDGMISSNIIAPSVFVAVFMVVFIPYAYRAFMKNREYEYGIFMALGMDLRQTALNILIESGGVAVISLAGGLLAGSILSFFFYLLIHFGIGVSGLHWEIRPESYFYTAALYAAVMLITLLFGLLGIARARLTDLLREKFRPEKTRRPLPVLFWLGIGFIIFSLPIMLLFNHAAEWFAGLGLLVFGGCLAVLFSRRAPANRHAGGQKHFLGRAFIRQHGRSVKWARLIAAWMTAFAVSFGGLSAALYGNDLYYALRYTPFDLTYSQIFGKNRVSDNHIIQVLEKNGVTVRSVKSLRYLRNSAQNLLPVSQVNQTFGCKFKVPNGKFIALFQFDPKDGYDRDLSETPSIEYDCGKTAVTLQSAGSVEKILFNDNPTFADKTFIVSDADFAEIASGCPDIWQGTAKFFSFTRWKDSLDGVKAAEDTLARANHVGQMEQEFYQASSRIETYRTDKQSAEFLMFLMLAILVLFALAANVMIHFKIKEEAEEEQRLLTGLNRLGATPSETLTMLRDKNMAYFLPQVLIGAPAGAFLNFTIFLFSGAEWTAAGLSLAIGGLLIVAQTVFSTKYSSLEKNKLNRQIQSNGI